MIKDSISVLNSLSRIDKAYIDSLLYRQSIHDISINVLGKSDSFLKIWIPVFVLASTLIFNLYLKKSSARNEINLYKELILNWIDLIQESIKNQIDALKDFGERIGNSYDIEAEKIELGQFHVKKLEDINLEKFANTFIINSTSIEPDANNLMTFNLICNFSYLATIESEIKSYNDKYQEQMNLLIEEFDNLSNSFDNLNTQYDNKVGSDTFNPNYNFHMLVRGISMSYSLYSPVPPTHKIYFSELINPLFEIVYENLTDVTKKCDYAYDMYTVILKLKNLESRWKKLISDNEKHFSGYSEKINESNNSLMDALNYFRKTTVKGTWSIKA